jgi:hypothetical protein
MATALLTLSPTWETAAGSGKFPQTNFNLQPISLPDEKPGEKH